MSTNDPPPKSPFELTITIGAHTWDRLIVELRRLAEHVETHGQQCGLFGGGGGANYDVTIETRDVTPWQYDQELHDWCERHRDQRPAIPPSGDPTP